MRKYKNAHERQVLALAFGQTIIICDEYYPSDSGRVHILGDARYATYSVGTSVLEDSKVAMDVRLLYVGNDWPTPLEGSRNLADLTAHFIKQV